MWLVIAGVVLVIWFFGMITAKATGALIHLLLIVALVFVVLHLIGGG